MVRNLSKAWAGLMHAFLAAATACLVSEGTRSHGLFQEGDGAYADYTGFDAIYDGLGYAGGGESSAIATHVYHGQDDILVRPHSRQLGPGQFEGWGGRCGLVCQSACVARVLVGGCLRN